MSEAPTESEPDLETQVVSKFENGIHTEVVTEVHTEPMTEV